MRAVLPYSLIVAMGYIPLGSAFGILYHQSGYPIFYAPVIALLVYAGSAQFLAITLLINHASILDVFIFTLILNSRHLFYALYTHRIYRTASLGKRLYLMLSLTDETFSIVTTLPREIAEDTGQLLRLSILNHVWWVLGCSLGVVAGGFIGDGIPGLEFVITSLFVILLVEQFYQENRIRSLLLGCVAAAISLIVFGGENFLLTSIGICFTIFIGYREYARRLSH